MASAGISCLLENKSNITPAVGFGAIVNRRAEWNRRKCLHQHGILLVGRNSFDAAPFNLKSYFSAQTESIRLRPSVTRCLPFR
jgi:hypothetical protein